MVRCPLVRRFKVGNVYTHLWEIATKEEVAGLCSSALEHERELVQLEMSSTLHDSFFFLRLFFGFFWTIFFLRSQFVTEIVVFCCKSFFQVFILLDLGKNLFEGRKKCRKINIGPRITLLLLKKHGFGYINVYIYI